MDRGVFLVAVAVFLHVGVSGWRHDGAASHQKHSNRATNIGRLLPELQNNTVVVAQVGGTATIKCYTVFLGDEIVTWMKRDEDQLLAVGTQVYSSDARYSVAHLRHDKLWEFSVRAVRKADAGLYECQLTTHPPTTLFFTLKVVEARAVLGAGGGEVHVHTGGRVRLRCTVEYATEPPIYFFWFHNHTMINYSPRRPLRVLHHHLGSSLVITNVTWEDAGMYTCEPHLAEPANLTLHVVEGEKHAALHNGHNDGAEQEATAAASSSSAGHSSHSPSTFLLIGYCCLLKMLSLFHHLASETLNTDSSSWL